MLAFRSSRCAIGEYAPDGPRDWLDPSIELAEIRRARSTQAKAAGLQAEP